MLALTLHRKYRLDGWVSSFYNAVEIEIGSNREETLAETQIERRRGKSRTGRSRMKLSGKKTQLQKSLESFLLDVPAGNTDGAILWDEFELLMDGLGSE